VLREPLFGCGMAGGPDGSLAGLLVLVGLALIRRRTARG
jgi:MYXO-CTERM domain-containing protein